jgi:hypothetical protein
MKITKAETPPQALTLEVTEVGEPPRSKTIKIRPHPDSQPRTIEVRITEAKR